MGPTIASYDRAVTRAAEISARSAFVSVFLMPLLILGGMLEWLVPATSSHAAGHGLDFAIIGAYPFLGLWLGAALRTARAVSHSPRLMADAALRGPLAALQWLLVAVALIGGLPLLTFDLAPDASAVAIGVLTASLFPVVVIGAAIGQFVLLRRSSRDAGPVSLPSPIITLIREHLRGVRAVAATASATFAAAAAGFLGNELARVLSGRAGDYGVTPAVLLIAVVAAGLPSSWVVAAVAGLVLVAYPIAGLGPAPAALDAGAIVALAVPAVVNAVRAVILASSDDAVRRWVHRHLDPARAGRGTALVP